jgi:hypothetical protein
MPEIDEGIGIVPVLGDGFEDRQRGEQVRSNVGRIAIIPVSRGLRGTTGYSGGPD